ncbi:type III restriction/modification enzyme restriction subunit [Dokdonia sp. Hel_I_63]|uniref:DEAD/DEAH box helicase family protein n=1 Tax=Dokdonia sp. Hel_I_63 TaxID=1249996 RepID=UPI0011993295|nr:DEAD/DEAH box helicase family protein [Dokdonia sp. Hel_I_63]TVZ21730.1 type III restriction/modification enzyme restriction subunit [Dokdonia sp. Hel_I_63]
MLKEAFHFIYPWRTYQERFLKDFNDHIADNHLHVVAPPGSGKTVLGLEMMRRVNEKTLVLAPTITIRNQWEQRMFECFVSEEDCTIPLSRNIKEPAHITFATYQSLHAFSKNEMEGDMNRLVAFFAEAGIKHIVLDEAHHLKNEWWKPLFALKKLEGTLTALTATPPYDSEQREISKYFQLCGPIDIEISVPELVREGNLCAHQDYIYFSEPDEAQIQYILKYRVKSKVFIDSLVENDNFGTFVLEHTLYTLTDGLLDPIYEKPDFYVAILVYLQARGHEIPKEKIEVIGVDTEKAQLPLFNQEWAERLLQPILVTDRELFIEDEEMLLDVEKQLRRVGAFENNRVNFKGERQLYKSLAQSPNKLKSICEIIDFEAQGMGEDLRAVILTDYVRKEFLESVNDDLADINKLGVVPIFHHLRHSLAQVVERSHGINKLEKLAVLTGTLVIVHKHLEREIVKVLSNDDYTITPLDGTDFIIVKTKERAKSIIVSVITQLFTDGHIQILVGTAALLGEGWDAPAINTLVLGSYVSSFVMSNQMRGRAIRVQSSNPDKVASIWHLACIDPTIDGGGEDVAKLVKRFDAFCGVSLENDPFIENGADRFALPTTTINKETINEKMLQLAANRSHIKERWNKAIGTGKLLVRELKFDFSPSSKKKEAETHKVYYKDAVKYSFMQLGAVITMTIPEIIINNVGSYFSKGMLFFIYATIGSIVLALAPKTYKAIVKYIKFGRIDKQVYKMGQVVLKSLRERLLITTQLQQMKLGVEYLPNGEIACFLTGATAKEEILFVNCLQELLEPVDNARYMIEQSGWFQEKFGLANYYSVPSIFTTNKKDASLFYRYWKIFVSDDARLTFTRTRDGRKQLLKARFHYLNTENGLKTKTSAIWR